MNVAWVWVLCSLCAPTGEGAAGAVGPRVAYSSAGVALPGTGITVQGQRLLDYTFGSAPTDWAPAGGTWAITSRYACEPEWSFFGGHSRGLCAIWNKRELRGDVTVEAYVAFQHGLPWASEDWHYVPSDLNINLHSRFGDLSSGYSFIFSGRSGSTTMIRRGAKVLAQTEDPQYLVPQFLDRNPLFQTDDQGRPFGSFHRHWWRLEVSRIGGRLAMSIDGKPALTANDPEPVEQGQVAFWTIGSGMVIARARIAYQDEVRAQQPLVVVREALPLNRPAGRVAER